MHHLIYLIQDKLIDYNFYYLFKKNYGLTPTEYREQLKKERGQDKPKKEKKKAPKDNSDKEGCLTKIIKAPFRILWWLIKFILKNALVILTFGLANGWFDDDKD